MDAPYPTNSALAAAYQQVTGTSWIASCRIPATFTSAGTFDNLRLEARSALTTTGAYVAVLCSPIAGGVGVGSEARAAAGGSTVKVATAANAAGPVWLFLARNNDTYTFYWSLDGNTLTPLGTTTQVMGNPLYVVAGANTSAGGPMTAQVMQQVNIQTNANWTLPLTNLSANTTYPVTVSATDNAGNVSGTGTTFNLVTAASGGGGGGGGGTGLFPRFGLQVYNGGLPTSANLKGLAPYPWVMLSINGGGAGRQASASGIKSYTGLGGIYAVKPIIAQYNIFNQQNPYINLPEWITVTNNNNWKLYSSGTSGAAIVGDVGVMIDFCDVVGQSSGLYPYEWAAQYSYNKWITGGGLATTSADLCPAIDCYYIDNVGPYLYRAGDWLRNGNSSSQATVVAAYTTGIAQFANKLNALDPSRPVIGNTAWGYAQTQGGNFANINGKFAYPMVQFVFGRAMIGSVVMNWGGFGQAMAYYKGAVGSSSNNSATITGGFNQTDYQAMRQAQCFILLDNGYFCPGIQPTTNAGDGTDGSNAASFPVLDEFWGGSLHS